jgi:hypothetical protein
MSTMSTISSLLPVRGALGPAESRQSRLLEHKLLFLCMWEQSTRALTSSPLLLMYYPTDDTLELRQAPRECRSEEELHQISSSVQSLPLVLKRQRVCKYASSTA